MSTTEQEDDIDYLHPDGKPATPAKKLTTVEEKATAEKSTEKSIAEADGHHICSDSCQKHHQV
ncbi:MAG: hypothetical protein HYX67_05690 [Candidatus Melainabacteria bacterium]|nr:hypothetical protein [Candidatus Melainabacteria bacterium]